MHRKALCLVLCLLPAPGVPSDWMLLSEESGIRLEFSPATISRKGDTGTAWDRTVSEQPRATPTSGDVAFNTVKTLVRYDCVRRTAEPVVRSFAFSDGNEVLRQSVEGSELPQPVVPDTPRERMLSLVCSAKSKGEGKPKGEAKPPQIQTAILPGAAGKPAATPARADVPKSAAAQASDAGRAKAETAKAPSAASPGAPEPKPASPSKAAKAANPPTTQAPAQKSAPGEKDSPTQKAAVPAGKAGSPGQTTDAGKGTTAGPDPSAVATKTAAKAPSSGTEKAAGKDKQAGKDKEAGKGKAGGKGDATEKARTESTGDAQPVRWSYEGAQQWHKLSRDFAACAEGKRQSPIDIRDGVRVQLEPIRFDYRPSPLRIVNTGHTVEVAYAPGSAIVIGETPYELVSFHFHHPAEERINGRVYEMSVHLVHKAKDGRMAMVAVLVIPGDENPFVKTLWNHLPLDVGLEESLASVQIDALQLLPRMRGYYTYMGSLTEPPCTEGVRWVVMRTPLQLSRSQISTFSKLYKMNARPVQAANGRLIKEVL